MILKERAASPGAAAGSRAVEIAVRALDEGPHRFAAVATTGARGKVFAESMEEGIGPCGCHPKDGARAIRPAGLGGAVEIPVAAFDEGSVRSIPVHIVRIGRFRVVGVHGAAVDGAEGIQRGQHAGGRQLEDRAGGVGTARAGRAVEIAVAAQGQAPLGVGTVGVAIGRLGTLGAEGVQGAQYPVGRQFEDRACVVGSPSAARAVEITVRALHQSCGRPAPLLKL